MISWMWGSVLCVCVSAGSGKRERGSTYRLGVVREQLGHAFGMELKELRREQQVARMLQLQRALEVLFWSDGRHPAGVSW